VSLYTTMLESVATLQRPQISRDSRQGTVQTFADVPGAVNIACSVQPSSSNDRLLYGQRNVFITCTVYFTQDIGAKVNDILQVEDVNGNLRYYQIKGFNGSVNIRFWAPYQCFCEEVSPNLVPQGA
jgi:hypothetical protein